jgi:hypothetical protein
VRTFRIKVSIGYSSTRQAEITLDDLGYEEEEWEALPVSDRNDVLYEYTKEWANDYIELDYNEV